MYVIRGDCLLNTLLEEVLIAKVVVKGVAREEGPLMMVLLKSNCIVHCKVGLPCHLINTRESANWGARFLELDAYNLRVPNCACFLLEVP